MSANKGSLTVDRWVCNAWCSCNIFGRNCNPCGTCNQGMDRAREVDDYSEYMAYSDDEKMVELSDTVCPKGKVAVSYKLHKALEDLADTNGDGFLSHEEFENAHNDVMDIIDEHCVYNLMTSILKGAESKY